MSLFQECRAKARVLRERAEVISMVVYECERVMKILGATEDDPVNLSLVRRRESPYSVVGYDACCFGGCGGKKKCRVCLGNPTGCDEIAWQKFKDKHGKFCSLSEWLEFKVVEGLEFNREVRIELLTEQIESDLERLETLSKGGQK